MICKVVVVGGRRVGRGGGSLSVKKGVSRERV